MRSQGRPLSDYASASSPLPPPPQLAVLRGKYCPYFTFPSTVLSWCAGQPTLLWDPTWEPQPAFAFPFILGWELCRVPSSPGVIGCNISWDYQVIHFIKPASRQSISSPTQSQEWYYRIKALQCQIPLARQKQWEIPFPLKRQEVDFPEVPKCIRKHIRVKGGGQGMFCGAHRVWTSTLKDRRNFVWLWERMRIWIVGVGGWFRAIWIRENMVVWEWWDRMMKIVFI